MTATPPPGPPAPRDSTTASSIDDLASLGQVIAGARTAEDIGARGLERLGTMTGATRAAFGVSAPGGAIRLVARRGAEAPAEDPLLLALAIRTGPLVLDAAGLAERGVRAGEDIAGWLGVPVRAGETVVGAISLVADRPGVLGHQALRTTQAVAAQAAVGLQNTLLLLALSEGKREWE